MNLSETCGITETTVCPDLERRSQGKYRDCGGAVPGNEVVGACPGRWPRRQAAHLTTSRTEMFDSARAPLGPPSKAQKSTARGVWRVTPCR
jgi:hypothetical protein